MFKLYGDLTQGREIKRFTRIELNENYTLNWLADFVDAFLGDARNPLVAPVQMKFSVNLWYRDRPPIALFRAFWYESFGIDTVVSRRPRELRATAGRTTIIRDCNVIVCRTGSSHVMRTPNSQKYFLIRPAFFRSSFLHAVHHRARARARARRRAFSFVLYLKRKRSIHCCHCLYTKAYYH